jgi:hypothetical protein
LEYLSALLLLSVVFQKKGHTGFPAINFAKMLSQSVDLWVIDKQKVCFF